MKYGSEISRRSVPEWRAYNLDYNEIKHVIKKATSSNAPPDSLDAVYAALLDQYESVCDNFSLHMVSSSSLSQYFLQ
jgi:SPX domain protein involved in polyphosphate accumulation